MKGLKEREKTTTTGQKNQGPKEKRTKGKKDQRIKGRKDQRTKDEKDQRKKGKKGQNNKITNNFMAIILFMISKDGAENDLKIARERLKNK